MEFMKSSLFVFIFILSSVAHGDYSGGQCLDAKFSADIKGQGHIFGLVPRFIEVEKSDCVISIVEKKWFWLKDSWTVDICREPIHLKQSMFSDVSVYKKEVKCESDSKDKFCKHREQLFNIIKDVGLIFAEGNRQDLKSDHGQVYCTYLLIKEYLDQDQVFISGQDDVFIKGLDKEVFVKEDYLSFGDDIDELTDAFFEDDIEQLEDEAAELEAFEDLDMDTDEIVSPATSTSEGFNVDQEPVGSF